MTTMTELELRQWLNRAFYADKKARALDSLVQQLRDRAQGLSGCGECNDKGKSDGTVNGTENALLKLAEIERKALDLKLECADILSETLTAIWKLEDDDLEAVLINRYALFYTIEQTAEIMHYSPRTVRKKQKQAIEKLCLKMPCNAYCDVL
jgi:DNA-directed RNA polymerase specialized sigma24 family protein